MTIKTINGFSKLSKKEKIKWLSQTFLNGNAQAADLLSLYWHEDSKRQKRHDEFIENAPFKLFSAVCYCP